MHQRGCNTSHNFVFADENNDVREIDGWPWISLTSPVAHQNWSVSVHVMIVLQVDT